MFEKNESYFQNLHKQGPTECANLFTGVFGEQEGLVMVITSRIKPKNLGHVVHCFNRVNVHQIHRLLYEQDETVWRLSTDKI